jgi:hypothetical protein
VNAFNAVYEKFSDQEKSMLAGPASIEPYKQCFRCGAPSTDFVPALEGDVPSGCTIQSIIAPGEVL